jgi:serine/threonine protein kinase
VREVTEGFELLYSHNINQRDVKPHNFLLDNCLSLKICDFGGSSLDRTQATVSPRLKYRLLNLGGTTVKEDLFASGSIINSIPTEPEPYEELNDENQVEKTVQVFPELSEVLFAEIITPC